MQSHQSNTDTMFSLREIVALKNVNDVYCISRSMFESVVNMGVLVTGKIKDGAQRFLYFQYLETYKILRHLRQVEPDFVNGFVELISKDLLNQHLMKLLKFSFFR